MIITSEGTKTINYKTGERCFDFHIVAPYQQPQILTQKYECIEETDGNVKSTICDEVSYLCSDLACLEFNIDGVLIKGSQILKFIYIANDNRDEVRRQIDAWKSSL